MINLIMKLGEYLEKQQIRREKENEAFNKKQHEMFDDLIDDYQRKQFKNNKVIL